MNANAAGPGGSIPEMRESAGRADRLRTSREEKHGAD